MPKTRIAPGKEITSVAFGQILLKNSLIWMCYFSDETQATLNFAYE